MGTIALRGARYPKVANCAHNEKRRLNGDVCYRPAARLSNPLYIWRDRYTVVVDAQRLRAHENDVLHKQVVWRRARLMRSRQDAGFFSIPSRFQLLNYRIGRMVKGARCS
jgi:hypothetical protein